MDITIWPEGPLPEPEVVTAPAAVWIQDNARVWAPRPYRLVEGRIEWGELAGDRTFLIPERLYLRELRDLELADPGQVVGFYRRFGALGVHHPGRSLIPPGSPVEAAADHAWTPTERRLGLRIFEHVEEFRWHAALVRNLTSIYHLHRIGDLEAAAYPHPGWDGEWFPPPPDPAAARRFLTTWLNRLLAPVRPEVGLAGPTPAPVPATGPAQPHTLLTALTIQLFNDIAAATTYKVCANERCRRLFVHQRGADGTRQPRTRGVMYCSARCARAQAQRAYRQRRRPETG